LLGEKDNLGRILGDAYLHAPEAKNIFVTGDTVKVPTDNLGNFNVMSCQHAMSLGRVAVTMPRQNWLICHYMRIANQSM
jgi:NADH dehydrogenase